jgi:UDP-galactopyranose mutase
MVVEQYEIGIAGAGFAGAVLARELVETGRYRIKVFEERDHVAGNCHTRRDPATGIMLHSYGPHIFNTSRDDVWEYMHRWAKFGQYTNRVKAYTARGVFNLPINLLTLNQFFNKRMSPDEAGKFLASAGDSSIAEPDNFEEQALKYLGRELYENFFYGYTKKQWGVDPKELPASILQRLPVRFNYDDNYYASKFQGIPIDGYTAIIERMLDHPAISVYLGEPFEASYKKEFLHVFYSGPIDRYFTHQLGRLQYRSLKFERFDTEGDFQGNPVINYCESEVPWTRIAEHKHFAPWENHSKTIYFREYSQPCKVGDIPYYPMRLARDKELLAGYMKLAEKEQGITFVGRLGTYRYLDMHVVIGETLDLVKVCASTPCSNWPRFSNSPL